MFTTGSKFFYGLAILGFIAAGFYAVLTASHPEGIWDTLTGEGIIDVLIGPLTLGYKGTVGDQLGFSVLVGFAATCASLGFFHTAFRDADPESVAELVHAETVPVSEPTGLSPWPIVGAFGVAVLLIGWAASEVLFVAGMVALVLVGIEWVVQAWSDRATGDPEVNRTIRNRVMVPIEIPLAIVIGIGVVVLSVSRVLLAVSATAAAIIAIVVATLVLIVAFTLASFPKLRQGIIASALLVAGVIIVGAGIGSALSGERDFETNDSGQEEGMAVVDHVADS
ncbi:MAG: hypothetical protein JJLCMIEE_00499 [Acidimicrobiales bacterium]|nr:MAG: hypothetical protein EDR02_04080 [Actinomycetota bacterium]MBV6507451.1 hypothetical protein [Acidimicrobiales bacterium]RIK07831.1 MAG: hypothetical protein DCC48_02445 [Acidobacteriota bacterium]